MQLGINISLYFTLQGDLLNELHKQGTIQHEDFAADGTLVAASVPVSLANRLEHLRVDATLFEKETTNFFRKRKI